MSEQSSSFQRIHGHWWAPQVWPGLLELRGAPITGRGIKTVHAISHQVAPGLHLLLAAEQRGARLGPSSGRLVALGEVAGSPYHPLFAARS